LHYGKIAIVARMLALAGLYLSCFCCILVLLAQHALLIIMASQLGMQLHSLHPLTVLVTAS